jgi:hypothetical protein
MMAVAAHVVNAIGSCTTDRECADLNAEPCMESICIANRCTERKMPDNTTCTQPFQDCGYKVGGFCFNGACYCAQDEAGPTTGLSTQRSYMSPTTTTTTALPLTTTTSTTTTTKIGLFGTTPTTTPTTTLTTTTKSQPTTTSAPSFTFSLKEGTVPPDNDETTTTTRGDGMGARTTTPTTTGAGTATGTQTQPQESETTTTTKSSTSSTTTTTTTTTATATATSPQTAASVNQIDSESTLASVDTDGNLALESWQIAAIAAGSAALLLVALVCLVVVFNRRRRSADDATSATDTNTPDSGRMSGAWDANMASARADDGLSQPSEYGVMPNGLDDNLYDISNLPTIGQ